MEDHNKLVTDPERSKTLAREARNEIKKCSLCGSSFTGWGHNADPFDGRCCEKCNREKVLPARMERRARGLPPRKFAIDHNVVDKIAAMMDDDAKPWQQKAELKKLLRDDFFYQGNPLRSTVLDMQTATTDLPPLETGNIEERNYLIHLYHLIDSPPPLVYSGASVFGHFLRALHDDDFILATEQRQTFRDDTAAVVQQMATLTPFVINHDWAKLLASAGEAQGGEYRLPNSEATVFEFSLEGMRVLIIASETDGDIKTHIWVRLSQPVKRWFFLGGDQLSRKPDDKNNIGEKFYMLCNAQIRAACVMLESQVAETETIRADYKRNEKRQRHGQTKFFDYHIINLAKRHRYCAPTSDLPANADKRASPRLHFVQGHWRHFDNWKTYVKWHYRGDGDLGFVDKEYRL